MFEYRQIHLLRPRSEIKIQRITLDLRTKVLTYLFIYLFHYANFFYVFTIFNA